MTFTAIRPAPPLRQSPTPTSCHLRHRHPTVARMTQRFESAHLSQYWIAITDSIDMMHISRQHHFALRSVNTERISAQWLCVELHSSESLPCVVIATSRRRWPIVLLGCLAVTTTVRPCLGHRSTLWILTQSFRSRCHNRIFALLERLSLLSYLYLHRRTPPQRGACPQQASAFVVPTTLLEQGPR